MSNVRPARSRRLAPRGGAAALTCLVAALIAAPANAQAPAPSGLDAALERTTAVGRPTVLLAATPGDALGDRLAAHLKAEFGAGGPATFVVVDRRQQGAWLRVLNVREFPCVVVFGRSKESSLAVLGLRQGIRSTAEVAELLHATIAINRDPDVSRTGASLEPGAGPSATPQSMPPAPAPAPPIAPAPPVAFPAHLAAAPSPTPIVIQPAAQPIVFAPAPPPTVYATAPTAPQYAAPGLANPVPQVIVVSQPGLLDSLIGTLGERMAQRKQPRLHTYPTPSIATAPMPPALWATPTASAQADTAPLPSAQSAEPPRRGWFRRR